MAIIEDTTRKPDDTAAPIRSPFGYLGGKSRLAKSIVAMFPKHLCYVEPFCGASWVYLHKEPSQVEVLNDRDGDLITFWRVIQNHLPEFLRYLQFSVVSREGFKRDLNTPSENLTDVQRAARYYRLQRMGFGGRTTGRSFGTSRLRPNAFNPLEAQKSLGEIHTRLHRTTIENLDAIEVIRRYDGPETLFYLDPPYWNADFYAVSFKGDDFVRLRDTLRAIEGKFVLSLNDTPEVRALFDEFHMDSIDTWYSLGNPRKSSDTRRKVRNELIIHNLPEADCPDR